MDARSQLRRYLEQRLELGESEFVIDGMTVDEALHALGGALRTASSAHRAAPITPRVQTPPPAPANPTPVVMPVAPPVATSVATPVSTPAPQPRPTMEDAETMAKGFKPGLVVGAAGADLATNPFAKLKTLDEIAKKVAKCTRCPLYETALNPVPGEGDPKAELMCVGEAPGANEDESGRPFVGAAGQLLTKILAAIELRREEVFICNVLKHRPPGNRNPRPDEVAACSPYLMRQIEIIRPKVIVAFGTFAAQTLLDTKTPIGKLRGMVHRYYGVPLVVTYHPAALLRNPAWKRPTWDDVKLARRVLDHPAV